jgi:hypothetical protein
MDVNRDATQDGRRQVSDEDVAAIVSAILPKELIT